MIFIQRSSEPDILINEGKAEQKKLCAVYEQSKRKFDFKSSIYGHQSVKTALLSMQHDKCCFCESKVTAISYGDVEHYRPKAAYKQNKSDKLSETGYYWLAYTWDNLLICCTLCNQKYKANLFPLLDKTKRAYTHHNNIKEEEPLLINPTLVNPEKHIGFREQVAYPVNNSIYGKTTIDILGLNREQLKEKRNEELAKIEILYELISLAEKQPNNQKLQELANKSKLKLSQAILPSSEYSAMIKSCLSSINQI